MKRGRFQKKSISTAVHHHVHNVTCSCSLNELSLYISFVRALKNSAFANAMFLLLFSLFCRLLAHIFTFFSPLNTISPHFHNTFISRFLCASCTKQRLPKFCSTIYLSQQPKRFHLSTHSHLSVNITHNNPFGMDFKAVLLTLSWVKQGLNYL